MSYQPLCRRLALGLLVGAAGCAAPVDDAPPASGPSVEAIRSAANVITIPVAIHFFYDRTFNGLPAFLGGDGAPKTIRDYDAAIARFNAAADAPRFGSTGGRTVHLVRAFTRYTPFGTPGAWPDWNSLVEPYRVHQAINVMAVTAPAGVAYGCTGPTSLRADPGAFPHEVGHALGLHHVFRRSSGGQADDPVDAAWVEYLVRDGNPASSLSCYRRGDATCDTVPDYGFVTRNANGSYTTATSCGTLLPGVNLCAQAVGGACNAGDALVDQVPRSSGGGTVCSGGTRTYDAAALGNVTNDPANIMSYMQQSYFTREQVIRMYDYALWRLRLPQNVPAAERSWVRDLLWAPVADNLWAQPVPAAAAIANANAPSYTAWSGARAMSAGALAAAVAVPQGDERKVLSARVEVDLAAGSPVPASLVATLTSPTGKVATMTLAAAQVEGRTFLFENGYGLGGPFETFRNQRPQGTWSISVSDPSGASTVAALRLRLVTSDRAFNQNDRYGRGWGDVLAQRGSTLWVSPSARTAGYVNFTGFFNPATPYPLAGYRVAAGDLDGDGQTDLFLQSTYIPSAPPSVLSGQDDFTAPTSRPFADVMPALSDEVLVGDFNGDGFGDLLRRTPNTGINRGVWRVNLGGGDGSFGVGLSPDIGGSNTAYVAAVAWTVGDFNGDGWSDIMVREQGTGRFWLSINRALRSVDTPSFYGGFSPLVGGSPTAYLDTDRLMAFDANGDGLDDIVERRAGTGNWWVSLNQNNWNFAGGFVFPIAGYYSSYLDTDVFLNASR
ncbi:MAG: hypothetical protein U0324_45555 [Polyangiales bacterium]